MPKSNSSSHLPAQTQFLIFTLFGEYVLERGGKIWTSDLLELMGLLGVSERAVRSTLSRMSRKGWVKSQKHGRQSQYYITPQGYNLLEAGERRIFEPIVREWDGRWHLVAYSLPEKKRRKRHSLRQQLTWLGYGTLAPGTWISPHNRSTDLKKVLNELKVEPYVDLFSGFYMGPSSSRELVKRCWDLESIIEQYQEFIDRHHSKYQECEIKADGDGQQPLDPKDCYVENFWLVHDFQSFPFKDPNLPTSLLPSDWIGFQARDFFYRYHRLLKRYANRFVDAVMGVKSSKPIRVDTFVSEEVVNS